MKQFFWKMPTVPVDADTAGAEMERVREENGGTLTAEGLLDASRAEEAPLHRCFEWRDHIAAEKYRLKQAGGLIHNIRIITVNDGETKSSSPVYVNVSKGNATARFKSIEVIAEDERDVVLKRAYRDFNLYRNRYAEILRILAQDETEAISKKMEEAIELDDYYEGEE